MSERARDPASHERSLLGDAPQVVSLGLDLFSRELEQVGVPVAHVDWRPPAHADPALLITSDAGAAPRPIVRRQKIPASHDDEPPS